MPQYLRPGVFVEEVSAPRAIEGTATDVGAFLGIAEKGDYEIPTLVTGWSQYNETFGSFLWGRYLAGAVYNFFNQGGSSCYISRAKPSSSSGSTGSVALQGSSGGGGGAGGDALTIHATSPGNWAKNISISVENFGGMPIKKPGSGGGSDETPLFTLSVVYTSEKKLSASTFSFPTKSTEQPKALIEQYILQNNIQPKLHEGQGGTGKKEYYYYLESYTGLDPSHLGWLQVED